MYCTTKVQHLKQPPPPRLSFFERIFNSALVDAASKEIEREPLSFILSQSKQRCHFITSLSLSDSEMSNTISEIYLDFSPFPFFSCLTDLLFCGYDLVQWNTDSCITD